MGSVHYLDGRVAAQAAVGGIHAGGQCGLGPEREDLSGSHARAFAACREAARLRIARAVHATSHAIKTACSRRAARAPRAERQAGQ
jgi:hypothetical protein